MAEAEAFVRASRATEAAAAPSPARAEPHDPQSWLPLPDVNELTPLAELEPAPVSGDDEGGGPASRPRTRGARRRPRLVFAAFLAVATVCATVWIGRALTAQAGAEVSLVVDGGRHSVRTDVPTVGALLAASRVRLGAADRVSPDSSTRLRDGMRVTVVRAFTVSVDVDGSVSNVSTTIHNANALAKELGLGKLVAVRGEPGRLDDGSEVAYRTRRTGSLMLDGQRIAYDSPSHTVEELLTTYNVKLLDDDRVEPVGPTVLTDGMEVTVVRVGGKFAYGTETIPFPTVEVPDSTLPIGETKVTQQGKDGLARLTYSVRLENGRQTSREVVSSVPSPAPVARVVAYGTKADWHWDALAQCESGGRWDTVDPGTSNGSGAIAHYDGGLGIYRGTWRAYGGEDFAPNAGLATREQQIIVGERIRADLGWDPWGCANNVLGWH